MKYCKNCSAPLDDDAVYCTECGASLSDDFSYNGSNYEGTKSAEGTEGTSAPGDSYQNYEHTIPTGSSENTDYSSNTQYTSNTQYNTQYGGPQQPKNPSTPWLIVSIVSFFCCSALFAIPGLVLAIMSTSSYNAGDYDTAVSRANTAKILTIVSIVIGVIVNIAVIVFMFSVGYEMY